MSRGAPLDIGNSARARGLGATSLAPQGLGGLLLTLGPTGELPMHSGHLAHIAPFLQALGRTCQTTLFSTKYSVNAMITKSQKSKLKKVLQQAKVDDEILGVFLYGSRVSQPENVSPKSDLDICLVLKSTGKGTNHNHDSSFLTRKQLSYLSAINPEKIDIQIFQQLPIYIRKEILEEGELAYFANKSQLYQLAYRTIQEYEDFAPRLKEYLRGVKYG